MSRFDLRDRSPAHDCCHHQSVVCRARRTTKDKGTGSTAMASKTWKEHLAGQLSAQLSDEIDAFEAQMLLRKSGKIEERIFAETRLRRGAYGQRYDNGRRHD